jgi:hypothetical protein
MIHQKSLDMRSRAAVAETTTEHAALAAASLIVALGIGIALLWNSPAKAYDDDVDVVCWDHDNGDTECMDVDDLAAECAVSDPEYSTDQCGGLLENRVPVGLTTKRKSRTQIDENYDDDNDHGRDPGGDRDPGGKGGQGGGQKGPKG